MQINLLLLILGALIVVLLIFIILLISVKIFIHKKSPQKIMELYTCPCCGYKTLDAERVYRICPICFWEDDPEQLEEVDELGVNKISLRQAQKNYIEFGASEKDVKKFVRKPNKQDIKDENWIPVTDR